MSRESLPDLYEAADLDAFWEIYRRKHADPRTRALYAVATASAAALLATGVARRDWRWIVLAPIVDYAVAQSSHRAFERNRTTPWRRPTRHLRAELRSSEGRAAMRFAASETCPAKRRARVHTAPCLRGDAR